MQIKNPAGNSPGRIVSKPTALVVGLRKKEAGQAFKPASSK